MKNRSKEDRVVSLFFNEPTRHWHFEEIRKETRISRKQVSRWLSLFSKGGLIKRIKQRNKMPYYVSQYDSLYYKLKKRAWAQTQLLKSGLFHHLESLKKPKAIILFGSMSRWDWHKESDVDLFMYGDATGLKIGEFERKLGREIQVFECPDIESLSKLPIGLLKNVVRGEILKGNVDFAKVVLNA